MQIYLNREGVTTRIWTTEPAWGKDRLLLSVARMHTLYEDQQKGAGLWHSPVITKLSPVNSLAERALHLHPSATLHCSASQIHTGTNKHTSSSTSYKFCTSSVGWIGPAMQPLAVIFQHRLPSHGLCQQRINRTKDSASICLLLSPFFLLRTCSTMHVYDHGMTCAVTAAGARLTYNPSDLDSLPAFACRYY